MIGESFMLRPLLITAALLVAGCSQPEDPQTGKTAPQATPAQKVESPKASGDLPESGVDYHSFANPDQFRVQHLALDLAVDFAQKELSGTATLELEKKAAGATELRLDTRDLDIRLAQALQGDNWQDTSFELKTADPHLGAALVVQVPDGARSVRIEYATAPGASGVQWLTPAQTAGRQHPFLFTQAQAIHARSFVPIQDTPQVRFSYEAVIRTPEPLRAVMSAELNEEKSSAGEYHFAMPQAIPSYLLALAVGDLEFKPMGARTGVWAEPSMLEAAVREFEDTEDMLEATEKVYGKYRWDRYDLLILPPSFPFGGMENPRLSFITPTVIAGDKSLVALIAHELAHSWSGNLVTNASWRDLWLNEGFTTYLTNRIMEFVFGNDRYRMEMAMGYDDLLADIKDREDRDEIMAIDLRGRDPDEVFSNIPYEKGSLFLYEIENKIGREAFDQFLLGYFDHFAFKSITTEDFLEYLDKTLLADHADKLDRARIEEWIFKPGLPAGAPEPRSDAFVPVEEQRAQWLDGKLAADAIDTSGWTFHHWKVFLDGMPEKLSSEQLAALDKALDLTAVKNNEVAASWLKIAVRNQYQPAYQRLEDFLTSIGRNKFLRPLYRALVESGQQQLAQEIFEKAKGGYHPLSVKVNSQIVYDQ
ncbi:M1 family metallopeptidase [Biformimicrobium ophioploci]|uniref:Aminopeptidase N n=2 Tax=Biformimicrobium ophioploci TaxID=3036711 RepID=A0ABQ6LVU2_9GAMM|nr:M1 family metallopeptidase [Microbulbifer sp. NKW57]